MVWAIVLGSMISHVVEMGVKRESGRTIIERVRSEEGVR